MRLRHRSALLAAALAVAPPLACAQMSVSFSGYGTVGLAHSDNSRADYIPDISRPNGPGYTRDTSFDTDTRLAGQVTLKVTPTLSGVLQVISQQRYDNTYTPTVEWANVKYDVTPDLSVRAGRVVLPIFLVTDTRRVGYANVWARPPVEVYSMVPVTHSDGADATWRLATGEVINNLQLTVGRSAPKFPSEESGSLTAKVRSLGAIVYTLERGSATIKASYGRAQLTLDSLNPLFDAFRQFGPPGNNIADRYEVRDRSVSFVGLGANYDPGAWFLTTEWARFDTHSVLGSRSAWYLSGGYRVNKFTPYATYARTQPERATSDPGLSLAGLPPHLRPVAAGLNAALNEQLGGSARQSTLSLGVRWDFWRSAALKLQYDDVRPGAASFGTFNRVQPGLSPGTRTRLFSVLVDFVF